MKSSLLKKAVLLLIGVGIGIIFMAANQYLAFGKQKVIVREPQVPTESKIKYSPPTHPKFSYGKIKKRLPDIIAQMKPEVREVTDSIFVASGYGLANVVMVITDGGLIILDTGDSDDVAKRILKAFRKITDKQIRYIILTHSHLDHVNGFNTFFSPGVEVITTEAFLDGQHYQYHLYGDYQKWARAFQLGQFEPLHAFPMPFNPFKGLVGITPPDIHSTTTFKDKYSFTFGGKRFELIHTTGETDDHLAIWMPDERILFPGDLYYKSFPNLSSPMIPSRDVRGWIDSLSMFIELEPEILIPHHTEPVRGMQTIREHLVNYREAIKFVHDETVRCINEGKSVEEAVSEIKLPNQLAGLPYLQELYGRVEWSVRGIYRGNTGWYNGLGTDLFPLPQEYRAREIVALAGGADKILLRAIELQKNGEHQLCAELCDIVIAANPNDKLAHRIKAESLHHLAFSTMNMNSLNFYRSAYSIHMKKAQEPEE